MINKNQVQIQWQSHKFIYLFIYFSGGQIKYNKILKLKTKTFLYKVLIDPLELDVEEHQAQNVKFKPQMHSFFLLCEMLRIKHINKVANVINIKHLIFINRI